MSLKEIKEYYSNCISGVGGVDYQFQTVKQYGKNFYESAFKEYPSGDECHLSQVVVNAGGKIYLINSTGLKTLTGTPTNRGISLFTQYFHEGSYEYFETQLQFHKGILLKKTRKIAKLDSNRVDWNNFSTHRKAIETEPNVPLEIVASDWDIWRD